MALAPASTPGPRHPFRTRQGGAALLSDRLGDTTVGADRPGTEHPGPPCPAPRTPSGAGRAGTDPVALLEEQAAARVPELVPIRYGRMLVSPFTFYRGAAELMAADLAQSPSTGLEAQLCGDAHLSNFGVFAAPDRRLVFSLNDFDETLPGPFEWDVKRMVASFAVAGRDRGFDDAARGNVNRPRPGPTARRCARSPRCGASTCGTPASTSTTSAQRWPR